MRYTVRKHPERKPGYTVFDSVGPTGPWPKGYGGWYKLKRDAQQRADAYNAGEHWQHNGQESLGASQVTQLGKVPVGTRVQFCNWTRSGEYLTQNRFAVVIGEPRRLPDGGQLLFVPCDEDGKQTDVYENVDCRICEPAIIV